MKKVLSCFISLLICVSLCGTSLIGYAHVSDGAEATGAISITAPAGTEIFLYETLAPNSLTSATSDGILADSCVTSAGTVNYVFKNLSAGNYHYEAKKEGCYSESQSVVLSDEAGTKTKEIYVSLDKKSGDGFEPDWVVSYTDEFMNKSMQSSSDAWGEEYSELFTTPYFLRANKDVGKHQQTTHAQMLEFIKSLDDKNDNMYVYSLGKSPKYGYEVPLVVFTKEDVSVNSSIQEIADSFKSNSKPTIHYQAQIHSNEVAAGESALAVIKQLDGKLGSEVLDNVDIYVVPRINADGAYENIRASATSREDMNRDFMSQKNPEVQMVTKLYNMFLPEVTFDGHEQGQRAYQTEGTLTDLDMQANGGLTHNNLELTYTALDMMRKALSNARSLGLRTGCYNGNYHGNSTASGVPYYAMRGSLSFLAETRGITAGMNWIERRMISQYTAVSTIIKYTAENADAILKLVGENRDNIVKKGGTYEEDDLIGLKHVSSYDTDNLWTSPKMNYLTGDVIDEAYQSKFRIYTTTTRTRPRPTAYVIPKGEKWADSAAELLSLHGVEYYELENNAAARLVQYKGSAAQVELCDERVVSFENGAYVFPMNQVNANPLMLIMEPDAHNPNNYEVNLISMGLIAPDENGLLPIYRYCYGLKDSKIILEPGKDSGIEVWENPFRDVSAANWHYDYVKYAVETGMFKGTTETTFSPDENLTRAMLVTILYRAEGEPAVNKSIPFADVDLSSYYANPVIWAKQTGIVNGVTENCFAPDEIITREQLAAIMYRYAMLKGKDVTAGESTDISLYNDFNSISEYAISAMQYAVGSKLITGKTKTTLNPADGTTRAEAAAVLYRFIAGEIIYSRREIAENYMREMANILWRSDKDILYTISSNVKPEEAAENRQFKIVKGRLYKGVPYTYSGGTGESFLEYASEKDENGIYTISNLGWEALTGGSSTARVGNDCSATVILAWGQFSDSIKSANTKTMVPQRGYLKVGDYVADFADNSYSWKTAQLVNGYDRMYKAYALLQKADAVVYRGGTGGHAMFVTDVDVVYTSSGEIDGQKSTITVVEQTNKNFLNEKKYFDEALGEDVYYIYGIDNKYTFEKLVLSGYLPITCKELRSPEMPAETVINDSLSKYSKDTILTGVISSNRFMDSVTVSIFDNGGELVQKSTARAKRSANYTEFDMQQFTTDPAVSVIGKIDVAKLSKGTFRCELVCKMVNGEKIVVRNFEFEN